MSEIFFRAKAIDREDDFPRRTTYKNGDWVYGLVTRFIDYAEMRNMEGISGITVDKQTVSQFTGFMVHSSESEQNHEMKPLFEKDICELTLFDCDEHPIQYIGTIEWKLGAFFFVENDQEGIAIPLCNIEDIYPNLRYLGNIYDNPELLESSK